MEAPPGTTELGIDIINVDRIRGALDRARVKATLTWSWAGVLGSLEEAMAEADALLIGHKQQHGRQS